MQLFYVLEVLFPSLFIKNQDAFYINQIKNMSAVRKQGKDN
jgi:hypothetical protein